MYSLRRKTEFILLFLFLSTVLSFDVSAKSADAPGEGGGNGNEIGPQSGAVLGGGTYLNPLTGMPTYSVKVARIRTTSGYNVDIDLHYGAEIRDQVTQDNALAPTRWVGLGWDMGFSTIYVVHKGTLAFTDDEYYYQHGNGSKSEIVKTTDGKYRIKDSPYWKVVPDIHLDAGIGNVIYGWTVTKTDGSVFKYGDFTKAGGNSSRYVYGFAPQNIVGTVPPTVGSYSSEKFHYQWDIREAADIYGSTIRFTYTQIKRGSSANQYIAESYPQRIVAVDNGDCLEFDLGDKNAAEWATTTNPAGDYHETKYLSAIRCLDKNNREIDKVLMTYSSDAGQVSFGTKRLLIGITSTKTLGSVNRHFVYDRGLVYRGLLTQISEPSVGKTTVYGYEYQTIYQTDKDTKLQTAYRFPVVKTLKLFDGVNSGPASVTTYTYPTADKDKLRIPATGLGFWGVVTANSGAGDVVTNYDINPDNQTFGVPLSMAMYNVSGNKLMTQETFSVDKKEFSTSTTDKWFYTFVTKTIYSLDNVKTISGTPFCAMNDYNGLSSLTYSVNSDGTASVRKSKFLHETFTDPASVSQLAAVVSTTNYEVPGYSQTCDLADAKVVSATYTSWTPISTGIYRPYKTYAWKAHAPVEVADFHEWNSLNPVSNGWQLTGTIEKVNASGSILDAIGPSGTAAASIYRSDYNLPIAKIENASYDECAVFTGDYDVADPLHPEYFDYANGWEKASSVLSSTKTHFGEKSVYVDLPVGSNRFGPTRNIQVAKIAPVKDYIMSAWVYVEEGTLVMTGDYRTLVTTSVPYTVSSSVYKPFTVPGATATAASRWQRLELRIPVSADITQPSDFGKVCVRMYIGAPNGVKAYIDDIRFYPAKAMMNTTYYSSTWRTARLEVSDNNNPSQLSEFDTYGRLGSTYKIDKTKSYQDAGFKRPIIQREYHQMGDDLRLLSPNGGETPQAGTDFTISWRAGSNSGVGSGGVDLAFYNGSTWAPIATVTATNSYVWHVPAGDKSGCWIKVVSHDNSAKWDQSDNTFDIVTNTAPPAPVITKPDNGTHYPSTTTTVMLKWNASIDPDGDEVFYKVEVKRDGGPWTTVVDNYGSTQFGLTLASNNYGRYSWLVTANDSKNSSFSSSAFYFDPPSFFDLRDINNGLVTHLPDDLYNSIYGTLSVLNQSKFAYTYRDVTTLPGYHGMADAGYFSTELSSECAFAYTVMWYQDHKETFEENGVCEGEPKGHSGIGAGPTEMRGIYVKASAAAPAMTLTWKYGWPGDGTVDVTWGTQYDPDQSAVMKFKWTTSAAGYHTWYRAYVRGKQWQDWEHDGDWTSDGADKTDSFILRMLKYDNSSKLEPPSAPSPVDNKILTATNIVLSWFCSAPDGDVLTYDVYLGEEGQSLVKKTTDLATASWPATGLEFGKTYKWKIVAKDKTHLEGVEGPVWTFTTKTNTAPSVPTGVGCTRSPGSSGQTKFTATWNASSDDEYNPITYTVSGSVKANSIWYAIGGGTTSGTSYVFPTEIGGTIQDVYVDVKACDGQLCSELGHN